MLMLPPVSRDYTGATRQSARPCAVCDLRRLSTTKLCRRMLSPGQKQGQARGRPTCEVAVIGAGPAGSTRGAARRARARCAPAGKGEGTRFHIGESLLPLGLPLFGRLGVADEMARIGMPKFGAEFVSPWHKQTVTFDFAHALDKSFPSAYQVRRSEFDHILFKNAVRKGTRAREACRVTAVDFRNGGRGDRAARGRRRAALGHAVRGRRFGRDTFLASRMGIKRRNRKHNSAAIYGHFTGAKRLPGKAEGNITVFWFDHGWFWFIPLADGTTSVGAVCWPYYMKTRRTSPDEFFLDRSRCARRSPSGCAMRSSPRRPPPPATIRTSRIGPWAATT